MENNNMYTQPQNNQQQYAQPQYAQQPVYNQQYVQQPVRPIDPAYDQISKDFLTKAIVSCAISSLPVGSIIAIVMATKNRAELLDYLDKGGMHTNKIKVSSALSRAGRYSGIGGTILWGIYFAYFAFVFLVMIIGLVATALSGFSG